MELRHDITEEERLPLRLLTVADRDRVVGREVATVVARADVFGSRHARRGAYVGLERRRPFEIHVLIRKHAVRGPAGQRQRIIVADRVAAIDEALETQAIGRLSVGGGRVLIRRWRGDDVALHHFGAVGQAIQRVDDLTGRRAVFSYRIDHIEHSLLDGDFLRSFGENIDQPQHAHRKQDEQADPAEEAEQIPNHVSASGNNTARPSGRRARPRRRCGRDGNKQAR